MASTAAVNGTVARGFEPVAVEFQRTFTERGELGAGFAAVRDGELVVDLWGGTADRTTRRSWTPDTLQLIFSGTKGLVAAALLLLIDRQQLTLDAPVCSYWPEFAAAGKADITVRQVVTHTARLPGLTEPVTRADLLDDRRMAELLARQPPLSDPRAARTYHALTYGWLCGELVRKIDGRSIGHFFADEFARPLGLEAFIGLPAQLGSRVSRLELADTWGATQVNRDTAADGDALVRAVWANPPVLRRSGFLWNEPGAHRAEIPGVNAIASPRSIAMLYANLKSLISPKTLSLGTAELERRHEPLLDEPQAFGVGFQLQTRHQRFGPPPDAFGHGGAGGSIHGCWPTQRIGLSYAMNLMRDDRADPRASTLLRTLFACVR